MTGESSRLGEISIEAILFLVGKSTVKIEEKKDIRRESSEPTTKQETANTNIRSSSTDNAHALCTYYGLHIAPPSPWANASYSSIGRDGDLVESLEVEKDTTASYA